MSAKRIKRKMKGHDVEIIITESGSDTFIARFVIDGRRHPTGQVLMKEFEDFSYYAHNGDKLMFNHKELINKMNDPSVKVNIW